MGKEGKYDLKLAEPPPAAQPTTEDSDTEDDSGKEKQTNQKQPTQKPLKNNQTKMVGLFFFSFLYFLNKTGGTVSVEFQNWHFIIWKKLLTGENVASNKNSSIGVDFWL